MVLVACFIWLVYTQTGWQAVTKLMDTFDNFRVPQIPSLWSFASKEKIIGICRLANSICSYWIWNVSDVLVCWWNSRAKFSVSAEIHSFFSCSNLCIFASFEMLYTTFCVYVEHSCKNRTLRLKERNQETSLSEILRFIENKEVYRKIPKISPGGWGLIYGGKFAFQNRLR